MIMIIHNILIYVVPYNHHIDIMMLIRQDTCFTDLVAKTKKFNKAQVEFRLANRIER